MYHTITPVTSDHDPVVIESAESTQLILFNAGPSPVMAKIWSNWSGKINGNFSANPIEPNFNLELRAGDTRIVSGAFIRLKLKNDNNYAQRFAAIGSRIVSEFDTI